MEKGGWNAAQGHGQGETELKAGGGPGGVGVWAQACGLNEKYTLPLAS